MPGQGETHVLQALEAIPGTLIGIGILLDATIIRTVLLPATMRLLGDWNWYLPKWLEWLPRLEHEKAPEASTAPVAGS